MQAVATPRPSDRAAFANQLAEVRAMDAKGEYIKQLNDLEVEYQFILLRSLDLFTKRCFGASCQNDFTASRKSFAILLCILHITPTFLTPAEIGTSRYAAIVTRIA